MTLQSLFLTICLSISLPSSIFTMDNNDFDLYGLDEEIKRLQEKQEKLQQEKKILDKSLKEIAVEYTLRALIKNTTYNKPFSEKALEQSSFATKRCCNTDDLSAFIQLIIHGLDLNTSDENGMKPLMLCSKEIREKICRYIRSFAFATFFDELCKHHRIYKKEKVGFLTFLKILKRNQTQNKRKLPKNLIIYLFSFFGMPGGSMSEIYQACFCQGQSTQTLESLITKWTTK